MIRVILLAKVILKKMVHKIINHFSQCTDILKLLLVLVVVITFITGNLKDCLRKELILLKHLIMELLQNQIIYGTKTRVEFNGSCLKQEKITYTYGKI